MGLDGNYMVGKATSSALNTGRQAGDIDISEMYPEAGLPRGLSLADFQEIEQIFFDRENGRDPRAILTALKVYERLGALLRANGISYPIDNTVTN